MKSTLQKWLLLVPVAVSLLFSGCDSTGTKGNLSSLSLSFTAQNTAPPSAKQAATTQSNHVIITEARMLIRGPSLKVTWKTTAFPMIPWITKSGRRMTVGLVMDNLVRVSL